ncbi:sugar phosphate isomerase [Cadophora sp. MPI-SDFR-AT-0126]|nr:sugar phosphate isomerase [Leotiomycetes sp. MPI-SDFR-AT-0126]
MTYRPSIASMSLGRAWLHNLVPKLDQAELHGFEGIEVFYEDIEYHTKQLFGTIDDENLISAAENIRQLADERRLEIICLQPFMHYEGLIDREEHAKRITKLKLWFKIAKALHTDTIQIPTNFLTEGVTSDLDTIVEDMIIIADLGLKEEPVIRFAYENLCWGETFDTWEGVWSVVERVDRPNFGMCLDTFNIAGRVWADPVSPDGRISDRDADAALRESLERMKKTICAEKVFYVQVVDAEKMRTPLVQGHTFHVEDQKPRMSWSRSARLFAFEEGGYLPVVEVLRTITGSDGLGYRGWISMELFSRTMADTRVECPNEHAMRGMESWKKIVEVMGWGS